MKELSVFMKICILLSISYVFIVFWGGSSAGFDSEELIGWLFPLIPVWGVIWVFGEDKSLALLKSMLQKTLNSLLGLIIKDYFSITGRINRKQYIFNTIILVLISSFFVALFAELKFKLGIILVVYALLWISMLIGIKRCHDIGQSAYFFLILSTISACVSPYPTDKSPYNIADFLGALASLFLALYGLVAFPFFRSKKDMTFVPVYKYERILIFIYIVGMIFGIFRTL